MYPLSGRYNSMKGYIEANRAGNDMSVFEPTDIASVNRHPFAAMSSKLGVVFR
jgi:hypothetical protein